MLALLLSGQFTVGSLAPAVTAAPSASVSPSRSPSPSPTLAEPTEVERPIRPAGPAPVADGAGLPVEEVRLEFAAGAVLDEAALAELEPVVAILVVPGAAPVLVQGHARRGPDEAAATALAAERAAVVVRALLHGGVPAQLLRQSAAVDADLGRAVVIVPDLTR